MLLRGLRSPPHNIPFLHEKTNANSDHHGIRKGGSIPGVRAPPIGPSGRALPPSKSMRIFRLVRSRALRRFCASGKPPPEGGTTNRAGFSVWGVTCARECHHARSNPTGAKAPGAASVGSCPAGGGPFSRGTRPLWGAKALPEWRGGGLWMRSGENLRAKKKNFPGGACNCRRSCHTNEQSCGAKALDGVASAGSCPTCRGLFYCAVSSSRTRRLPRWTSSSCSSRAHRPANRSSPNWTAPGCRRRHWRPRPSPWASRPRGSRRWTR
jgi:hypothetical protein